MASTSFKLKTEQLKNSLKIKKSTMKTIILFGSILLLTFSLNAQSNCLKDSAYSYNAQDEIINKYFYFYDSDGLLTESITQEIVNSTWVNSSRELYSWTPNELITERITQDWDNNQWENQQRNLYLYTITDEISTSSTEVWDAVNSTWIYHFYRVEKSYNAQNQCTHFFQVYWNMGTPEDSVKHTFSYDVNDNEVFELREGWNISNPVWQILQKWESVFTQNNQEDTTYNYLYNQTTSQWDYISKWTYLYDGLGNTIQYTTFDSNNNFTSKQEYSYDANNNRDSTSSFYWQNSMWRINSQVSYTFHSSNQPSSYLYEAYNSNIGALVNSSQYLYTYDSNDNQTWVVGETWNTNSNSWDPMNKTQNFYSCGPLSNDEMEINEISLFPNPTNGVINIQSNQPQKVKIFTLEGKLIDNIQIFSNTQYDASYLSKGIYFIQLENGTTQKFIKQ
jgi:hypothetical protein